MQCRSQKHRSGADRILLASNVHYATSGTYFTVCHGPIYFSKPQSSLNRTGSDYNHYLRKKCRTCTLTTPTYDMLCSPERRVVQGFPFGPYSSIKERTCSWHRLAGRLNDRLGSHLHILENKTDEEARTHRGYSQEDNNSESWKYYKAARVGFVSFHIFLLHRDLMLMLWQSEPFVTTFTHSPV